MMGMKSHERLEIGADVFELHALRTALPRGEVGETVWGKALERLREVEDFDTFRGEVTAASRLLNHLYYANAFHRSGCLDEWFVCKDLNWDELLRRAMSLVEFPTSDTDLEDEQREEEWDRAEDEGAYGRSVRWQPQMDEWIFVRFGALPKNGYSRFGLAGEDTEDGPDPWRVESGNKTRESGACVLRAIRHPDVPDTLVLVMPHFDQAVYGVGSSDEYLGAIAGAGDTYIVEGRLVRWEARDGCPRCELGSDGEYLLDPKSGLQETRIDPERLYVAETMSFVEWRDRRGSPAP